MRLAFADPRNLTTSPLNMNHGRPAPDVSDILPSVRKRGVLLTLLVLETMSDGSAVPDTFEVVAGRRRMHAAQAAIAEGVEIDPVPIAILEPGDDAAAIEASLIENLGRLPPDEVTCWETFTRLIKSGRSPEQIAATFGMSDVVVKRTLALGGLLPRVRNLYRAEEIDVAIVRQLTLATKAQQKAWLALYDDPDQRAPQGAQLKAWLFGGASIPTKHAMFPLDAYPGQVVADLFGEECYFSDPDAFWALQNAAIADRVEALKASGWIDVEVMAAGDHFYTHEFEQVGRKLGGRVYVQVSARGEVAFHEGWLTRKEAKRARASAEREARNASGEPPPAESLRSEITGAQETYIDLHRHAAVRMELVNNPAAALRLLLAHALTGTGHWRVDGADGHIADPAVAESLAANSAAEAFEARRQDTAKTLGLEVAGHALVGSRFAGAGAAFAKLLAMSDADVLDVAAVVMADSLRIGSVEVDVAGAWLHTEIAQVWRPDAVFLDLIRDRETINAMLREVGGRKVAEGNLTEKIRTQKGILRDFLDGEGDRPKAEGWTPRWMGFPASAYTRRPCGPAARSRSAAQTLRKVVRAAPKSGWPVAAPEAIAAE
ncbi:ParB/RepB/Spo0J family partition protein [Phenylobacterium sp.]|uniref:ParB/RepB/Spo0J family partition protein n=1 Tax=Phenylobacterium sp. TaxID=1871053 RepID=UPI003567178C